MLRPAGASVKARAARGRALQGR